ncbi:MAG: pentapeptide repeat-containing protein, partial [Nitrospiraceae bacterium]
HGTISTASAQVSLEYAGKYLIAWYGLPACFAVQEDLTLVIVPGSCHEVPRPPVLFTVYTIGSGGVAFQAENGKFLTISSDRDRQGNRLIKATAVQPGPNETFILDGNHYQSQANPTWYLLIGYGVHTVFNPLSAGPLLTGDLARGNLDASRDFFRQVPDLKTIQTQKTCVKCNLSQVIFPKAADLSGVDFSGANFSQATLDQANLAGATLSNVNFSGATLAGVDFSNLNLTGAVFSQMNLTGQVLTGAILDGAHFEGATLTNADLTYVHASGAIFSQAHLEADQVHGVAAAAVNHAYLANAKFDGANLSYADFSFAMLNGPTATVANATLTGSTWVGANLSGLDLSTMATAVGINLENANLANTTLKNANLSYNLFEAQGTTTVVGAKLDTTYLCGCTLDSTNLTCADLANAYILNAPQTNPDGNGTPASCAATVITNVKTDSVHTTTPPVTCDTTCPDGTRGPCANDQWKYRQTGPAQCCVAPKGGPPCPPRKREGAPCTKDCDCHSARCTSGACAPDSSNATPARRLP